MEKVEELVNKVSITDNEECLSSSVDLGSNTSETSQATSTTGAILKLKPTAEPPAYIAQRLKLFTILKMEYDEDVACMQNEYICVNIPEYNRSIAEVSWETTPVHIARYLGGEALLEKTIVARVNDELWDLNRPLEKSCTLEFLDFYTPEGRKVFRHSSAHVLGQAAELKFDCLVSLSTTKDDDFFFYKMGQHNRNGSSFSITKDDIHSIQDTIEIIISEGQKFERLVVEKYDLVHMFSYSKYKLHQISKIPDGGCATVYRCGPFIDLCVGPHIRDIGRIGAFQLEAKFPPDHPCNPKVDYVHRLYSISFPEKCQLEEYNRQMQIQHEKVQKAAKLEYSEKMRETTGNTLYELITKDSRK